MGGNCAIPRGSLRCPQKPPGRSTALENSLLDENRPFLGVSETPKNDPQIGFIKVAMPGSIRVASDIG